jgi:hypothetical protein
MLSRPCGLVDRIDLTRPRHADCDGICDGAAGQGATMWARHDFTRRALRSYRMVKVPLMELPTAPCSNTKSRHWILIDRVRSATV